ncbi:MAG TPA: molybdopterin cofactor-binding domain-containing protein [Acidothermaceae bacterium]|nr:molybdopterin cofactor-binding domain-containing protein [Acidothermaceae bacterium]
MARTMSRRQFFSRAGTLAVAFSLAPTLARSFPADVKAAGASADLAIDSWLVIGPDNRVTIYSGKVELGTGVQTALTQIVAEELYLTIDQISFVQGDTSQTPGDKGYTAGSQTIQSEGPKLRIAAATAFQALLKLASQQIGVSTHALRAQNGQIGIGHNLNRARTYGQLIGQQQIQLTSDATVAVKDPADYTVVGTPLPRVDLPDKFLATFTYMQDVKVDGMLHARVVRPAGRNATFVSFDESLCTAVPGFVQVVQQDNFVGVVANDEWAAIQAAKALHVTWQQGAPLVAEADLPQALRDPANIYQTNPTQAPVGDVDSALAGASVTLEADYFTPFQMHASIGPSCGVADVRGTPDPTTGIQATVWSGTQGVYPLQGAIAGLLGISTSAVRVIYVEAAGCYGHNGADDVAADAALLSQAVGKPVRVQWMRQDEHGWEPLGPAMAHTLRGGLDANGGVVAWDHTVWTPSHSGRPGGKQGNLLAGQETGALPNALGSPIGTGTRNQPVNYAFPNNRVTENAVANFAMASGVTSSPLTYSLPRTSSLRSLGGFSNSFANESFMDELAAKAGADPFAFRMGYLSDPRAIAVMQAMANKAGLSHAKPPAQNGMLSGRGISYLQYENKLAYVAAAAEVQVNPTTGTVQVTRVVVAHDCGQIINPDGLMHQIEGNVIQAVSRTLKEQVTFDANRVTSVVWASNSFFPGKQYSILNFTEVPTVEVVLIDQPTLAPWGAGEPTIEVVPSAIGNAIFDAAGIRLRTIPFTPDQVLAALNP